MSVLKVRRVHPNASLPRYASQGAAGLDLSACLEQDVTLAPGGYAKVPTGIAIALPPGTEGQVRPRSGLAAKFGVGLVNAPGTIDEDYRGEIAVLLINHGREPFTVHHGDRIAQLVVARYERVTIEDGEIDATTRGSGGFGSTGV